MKAEEFAPVIRGVTYNGSFGAVAVFEGENGSAPNTGSGISISKPSDPADAADMLSEALAGFRKSGGDLPETVEIEGTGVFRLSAPARVAVVTGGAQGFGAGIVRELAAKGCRVFIADMNIKGAEAFAAELNSEYGDGTAESAEVNVSEEASVARMITGVVKRAGGIDLFVNNAGVLRAGSVKEQALADFEFVTRVNYTGYFLCVKYASRVMAAQNSAAEKAGFEYFSDIIQINSKSGLQGSNRNGAYAGGKFGGIGLTQSFAMELVEDNIKVNSICPGNYFEGPLWSDPDRGLFVQYLNAGKVPGAETVEDVKAFLRGQGSDGTGLQTRGYSKGPVLPGGPEV